jgi:hypothetical protein
MGFVAGAYLAVYNSKVVGQTAAGFRFHRRVFKRLINGDWMGMAAQDAIYMGAELMSDFTLLEYDAPAVVDIIRPYNGSTGGTDIYNGMVGVLDRQHGVVKSLVLTGLLTDTLINANGGSGASSVLPLTRTLPRSILAENYPLTEALSCNLRDLPIRMRHYPSPHNQSTGVGGGVFGSET